MKFEEYFLEGSAAKVWSLRPLGGFKVDSAFYDFEVNQMSTKNSRGLSGKYILRQ